MRLEQPDGGLPLSGSAVPGLGEVLIQHSYNDSICLSVFHSFPVALGHHSSWGHTWAQVSQFSFSLVLLLSRCDGGLWLRGSSQAGQ